MSYDWFDLSLNKFNRELTFNLVQVIKLELHVYIIARTLGARNNSLKNNVSQFVIGRRIMTLLAINLRPATRIVDRETVKKG